HHDRRWHRGARRPDRERRRASGNLRSSRRRGAPPRGLRRNPTRKPGGQHRADRHAQTQRSAVVIVMSIIDWRELDADAVAPLYAEQRDRKSTRLNSSHVEISYAVFCLKKKKNKKYNDKNTNTKKRKPR